MRQSWLAQSSLVSAVLLVSLTPMVASADSTNPEEAHVAVESTHRMPEDAVTRLEKIFELTTKNPKQWAGGWFDESRQQVVAGVVGTPGAEPARSAAAEIVSDRGRVESLAHSAAELFAKRDEMIMNRDVGGTRINAIGVSWDRNGLRVGVEKLDPSVEAAVKRADPRVAVVQRSACLG